MEEARSLTYSINVETNAVQAESELRNLVGNIGNAGEVRVNADISQAEADIENLVSGLDEPEGIQVDADTSQAEAEIKKLHDSLGALGAGADSIGQAFSNSLLDGINSGESFASSLRSGVGGAFACAGSRVTEFRDSVVTQIKSASDNVVSSVKNIGNGFAHPIETIRSGIGGAIDVAKGKVIELASSFGKARQNTSDFDRDTDSLRKTISNQESELQKLKQSYANLALSEDISSQEAKNLAAQIGSLSSELQGNKSRLKDAEDAAEQLGGALDDVGDDAADARPEIDGLGNCAESSGSKFEKFGGVLKGIGAGILAAATAATTAVAAIGGAAVKSGMEYESAFAQVQTIMDTAQMSTEDMSASIKSLSSEMGISALELSETVYNAISATGDTANAVNLAGQASKLATAGFTDTSSALSVLTTAMNAYGLSADEASNISDSLIQVQNLGVTTVSELASNMGKAIASASAYGVNLTNLESAYVSITKAGINTAEGTTYISSMMKELGDSGTDVAGILKEKTGKSFDQLMAEGSSLGDVLGILNDSVNGDSTALMNLWSSAEAGKASAAIIGQGLDTFNENLKAIGESAGATEDAYSIMADTLEHKTEVFRTTGTNLLSSIYTGMSGQLSKLMDFANGAMNQLADAFEEGGVSALIGALGNVLSDGLSMVIGMLPAMIDAGMQLLGALGKGILDNLPMILDAAMQIVGSLGKGILGSLPTLIGAAARIIVTLASGIGSALPELIPSVTETIFLVAGTLLDNLPQILDAGMQILGGFAEGILGALPILVEQLPEIILQMVGFFSENLPEILEQGSQMLLSLGMGIITAIPQLVAQLPEIITSVVGFVTENLPLIAETGVNLLVQLGAGIIQAIPQLVESLPQIIGAIIGGFAEVPGMMLDIGKNIVEGVWNGISQMGSWIKEKVSGFFGGIVDGVKGLLGIHSPSTVFAGIGDNMAAGLGKGFEAAIGGVTKDIENSIPTGLDLPMVNVPDISYGVEPVVGSPVLPSVSDVPYDMVPTGENRNDPHGITPVIGNFSPPDAPDIDEGDPEKDRPRPAAGPESEPPPSDGGDGLRPYAPQVTIVVQGNADKEIIDELEARFRRQMRELYEEFREEELERQALKNQHVF